jgi:hypothetical protein
MLFRKPLPLSIGVAFFVVSVAVVPLACRLLRRPAHPPHTLTELTQLLSQDALSLYVVPMVENRLEEGIYICANPQPHEQLWSLVRNTKGAGRWQGVVYCEKAGKMAERMSVIVEREILEDWGEYGMQIGPLLFFGDPALLRRIHKVIFDHQGSKCDS